MKVITELNDLSNFDFWGGARDFANKLSYEELEILTQVLEEIFPDGIRKIILNDTFWFEQDWLCAILSNETGETITVDDIDNRPNRWEV